MKSKKSWVIEFDYDADPDLSATTIVDQLRAELAAIKGQTVWQGTKVTLNRLDDAFAMRMRFSHNVTSVTRF